MKLNIEGILIILIISICDVNCVQSKCSALQFKVICMPITFNNSLKACFLMRHILLQFKHAQHKL